MIGGQFAESVDQINSSKPFIDGEAAVGYHMIEVSWGRLLLGGSIVFRGKVIICTLWALLLTSGCTINLSAPESLLPIGSAFVISGTASLADNNGPCLVWIAENGVTYHLFQSSTVENETFDRIATPGVTSRLLLAKRSDLEVNCLMGTIVEVQDVLEIVE
jgi:hypothetical protein